MKSRQDSPQWWSQQTAVQTRLRQGIFYWVVSHKAASSLSGLAHSKHDNAVQPAHCGVVCPLATFLTHEGVRAKTHLYLCTCTLNTPGPDKSILHRSACNPELQCRFSQASSTGVHFRLPVHVRQHCAQWQDQGQSHGVVTLTWSNTTANAGVTHVAAHPPGSLVTVASDHRDAAVVRSRFVCHYTGNADMTAVVLDRDALGNWRGVVNQLLQCNHA